VEYGVDADESGLWFKYVHGLADVVAIGRGFVFVDFEDDVVVVCVLRGSSKDSRVLRWKSRPGGDEPGYVVVKFNVHRMGSHGVRLSLLALLGFRAFRGTRS